MNHKKRLLNIVILFFYLFMLSIIVFNCFKTNEKEIESTLVDNVDNRYFSSSRLKNKKEKSDSEKSDELKVLVFEKKKDDTIRLVFSHPVLYDEEVGKIFTKLFFYFSPGIKGKFITRSNRIVDFIPSDVEYKESFLIIPKDLYGINGNVENNEIKINVTFNNSQNEKLTFFDSKEKNDEKITNIYSLLKKTSTYNYTRLFEPAIFKVTTEIDLENSRENTIGFSGNINVNRFYKKIEKNDVSHIIKNADTPLNIKNYFLNKNLNVMPNIRGAEIINKAATYIPSTRKGIYFCYQAVKEKGNDKDFFQLYNFSTASFAAFDTEKSILIWDKSKNENNAKFSVYSASGKIIDEFTQNKSGFYKIRNAGYSEVFIFKESINNSLFRIKLNKIVKSDYNVFSLFDDSDAKNPEIIGIISNRDGSYIKNIKSLNLSFKIMSMSNNRNILQDSIKGIGSDGSFKYVLKKNILEEDDLSISYYINDQLLKKCIFKSPLNNSQFHATPKVDTLKLIAPKENVIFYDAPAYFVIKDHYEDQIDSIFVSIKDENNKNTELMIDAPINKTIKISLPPEEGDYLISFEFYLKNGTFVTNNLKVKKITSIVDDKTIVYNNDSIKKENGNYIYEVFNPLNADKGILILFNNDLNYYKEISFNNGYNRVSIDSKFITSGNMKALVLLSDFNNRIIYNLKNNLTLPGESNNLAARIQDENDDYFTLIASFNKLKYLNNKIYVSYTPLNDDSQKNILNDYNDFINPQIDFDNIYPGMVIEINDEYSNKTRLKKYKSCEYNLNIFLKNEHGKILNTKKSFKNKRLIDTTIYGPDEIDILDKPEYLVAIENYDTNNITIDAVIKENNEVMFSKQKILIKGSSKALITYNSQNNIQSESKILAVVITSQKRLIDKIEKKIKIKKELVNQSIEVAGSLYDKDKTSSYLKLPESGEKTFNIDVILSPDKSINILKSNPLLYNYFSNNFELDLLKYLNSCIDNLLFYTQSNIDNITKYYIEDQGVKRNLYDKAINLDSTLMLLFSALIIPEINKYFDIDNIINYLITNYKEKIMASPLSIFILAEYGIFFDSISKGFLSDIENARESILFYRYYKNKDFNNNFDKEYNESFNIYYDSYKLSSAFYLLLFNYYEINNNIDINKNFIFYQYPVESVFEKLILIKEKINKKDNKNTKGEISFKSEKLGDFQINLMSSDIYVKKYFIELFGFIKNERLIDYTIEKNFKGQLNYIIKADYKTKPAFTQKNNVYLYSEWSDESGDIIDKNNLVLKKNMTYKINIYLINNNVLKDIVIKPLSSSALDLDYESFFLNEEKIIFPSNKKEFITIKNLDKGINMISFSATPKYNGVFKVNGITLTDLNDSTNFLHEKDAFITIINNF